MTTVEDVIADVFGVDRQAIDGAASPETIEGWDSMGHLNLVCALEERFHVSIDIADAMDMVSVAQIKQLLLEYGVRG